MLGILDYGMGNLRSVQRALEHVADGAMMVRTPSEVGGCDKLIVPGVGAFGDASTHLRASGLGEAITRFAATGRPLLGICLGMQLFVEKGHEDGEHPGLGLLPGECRRFDVDRTAGLKVPHMGWNALDFDAACPLFAGLQQGAHAYFVHAYHVVTDQHVAATTDYGGPVVSALWHGNIYATQFHPEKSQDVGLTILQNFSRL
jgi:glutamine amidotransferase